MIKPQISSRNLNYELTNLNFIMFCQIFHFANEFKSLLKRRNNFFLIIHNLSLKNLNLFKLKISLVGHFVHKGTVERFLALWKIFAFSLCFFLRYFILFDRQMSGITSHMRNDLSKKFVYLFHSRTKSFKP